MSNALRVIGTWLTATALCTAPAWADADVVVGLLPDMPPFQQWPEGAAPSGYDVDLLAELSQSTGRRFAYRRFANFDELQQAMRKGDVHLATSVSRTATREPELVFTRPYVPPQQQALLARNTVTSIPGAPDLAGRCLALLSGHASAEAAIDRFPLANRRFFPDVGAAVAAVAEQQCDLAFGSLRPMTVASRQWPDLIVARRFSFATGHLRLAGPLSQGKLVGVLDAALAQRDPARDKALAARWLEPLDATPPAVTLPHAALPAEAMRPLRVGYLPSDRPATYTSRDGAAQGLGIDLLNAVIARVGLTVKEFVPIGLSRGLEELAHNRLDVMLGAGETAQWARQVTFVGPYKTSPLAIVSRESDPVLGLDALRGERLAMAENFFARGYVSAMEPTIDVVDCPHSNACFDLVEQGLADATIHQLDGLMERLHARGARVLSISGVLARIFDEDNIVLSPQRAALALPLRQALDQALQEDLPRIERSWAERNAEGGIDWQTAQRWLLAGLGLVALLFGAWWLHARRLHAEAVKTQAARQETEQYLAFMAHEVRNALQSVAGAVSMLGGPDHDNGGERRSLLQALSHSARSTLGLMDGLLDRHRLRMGRFEPRLQAESLLEIVRSVVDEVRPAAQNKGLTLTLSAADVHGMWMVDALRLQQVVRNLVVNAVKFAAAGRIDVGMSLRLSARGDAWRQLRIAVSDEGPGIAPQRLPTLFKAQRSLGGDRNGSGMGLHLSREILGAMGGTLDVQSQPGRGACFALQLDLQPAPRMLHSRAGSLQRVLIVEDEQVYAMLLQHVFEAEGIEAHVVDSVVRAEAALVDAAAPFDLLLSDVNLVGGTLFDLLDRLQADPKMASRLPPIVAMSASADAEQANELERRGVIKFLTKDADVDRLCSHIREAYDDSRTG
jgi:signal transduction histidine kinase/ActR/RegA family two-component response regulator